MGIIVEDILERARALNYKINDVYRQISAEFFGYVKENILDRHAKEIFGFLLNQPCQQNPGQIPSIVRSLAVADEIGERDVISSIIDLLLQMDDQYFTPQQIICSDICKIRWANLKDGSRRGSIKRLFCQSNLDLLAMALPSGGTHTDENIRIAIELFKYEKIDRKEYGLFAYNLLFMAPFGNVNKVDDVIEEILQNIWISDRSTDRFAGSQAARTALALRESKLGLPSLGNQTVDLPDDFRLLVCVSGQLRGFRKAWATWNHFGLRPDRITYVLHSWNKIGRKKPTLVHADRCFSGIFLNVIQKIWLEREDIESFLPNLFALANNDEMVTGQEIMARFPKFAAVEMEDDNSGEFCSWDNSRKMHYKIEKAHELGLKHCAEPHLILRIRPDLALDGFEPNWKDIFYQSFHFKSVFTTMKPSVFLAGGRGIGDILAIGAAHPMDIYSRTFSFFENFDVSERYLGVPKRFAGHESLYLSCMYGGCMPGVMPNSTTASPTLTLCDPAPLTSKAIQAALEADARLNGRSEVCALLLEALYEDTKPP